VKLNPLVDSQEYKDILNNIAAGDPNVTTSPVGSILSTYNTYNNINQAIVRQAETDVPLSGYDTKPFFELPAPLGDFIGASVTADLTNITADQTVFTADSGVSNPDYKMKGYLTGDGLAPSGATVSAGIGFPNNPNTGDYWLRLDYLPNRLFRFTGSYWQFIEDSVRTNITPGAVDNLTQRAGFQNDTNTYTDSLGQTHNELQPLSQIFKPKADN
jgi:hypothetical protein